VDEAFALLDSSLCGNFGVLGNSTVCGCRRAQQPCFRFTYNDDHQIHVCCSCAKVTAGLAKLVRLKSANIDSTDGGGGDGEGDENAPPTVVNGATTARAAGAAPAPTSARPASPARAMETTEPAARPGPVVVTWGQFSRHLCASGVTLQESGEASGFLLDENGEASGNSLKDGPTGVIRRARLTRYQDSGTSKRLPRMSYNFEDAKERKAAQAVSSKALQSAEQGIETFAGASGGFAMLITVTSPHLFRNGAMIVKVKAFLADPERGEVMELGEPAAMSFVHNLGTLRQAFKEFEEAKARIAGARTDYAAIDRANEPRRQMLRRFAKERKEHDKVDD